MLRLIRADLLKLERRRAMLAIVAGLVFAAVGVYFGVGAILDKKTDFDSAAGILVLLASVAGAIIGATAGGADLETGVFRDLVATGRSRTALFFARVPAAWAIVHEGTGRYRKLVITDGKIAGAILLGPGNDVAAVRTAITRGLDVTPVLGALRQGRLDGLAKLSAGPLVPAAAA